MRYRFSALLALFAALALGACSLGPAPAPPAPDQPAPDPTSAGGVTITFGSLGFMRHAYDPLIDAFNAQHPGITVQFVALDEAYRSQGDSAEQMRQIVSRADTSDADASEAEFDQGLLRDLAPLIDADAGFNRDDLYPGALAGATAAGGAIYKLPRSFDLPVLFYNKDLWAARGLAAPRPDWGWQDLVADAGQLARKQGPNESVYGLADPDAYLAVLLTELRGAGVDLLAAPPDAARLDRPEAAAALQRIADLFSSDAFYDAPAGSDWRDQAAQLVAQGRVGMWGPSSARGLVKSGGPAQSFAAGVAAYPAFPGGAQSFSRGYIMSSGTLHPQEAWAWLSFLSAQQVADLDLKGSVGDVNVVPARKSLAEQSGFWSGLDQETRDAFQTALARPASGRRAPEDLYQPLIEAMRAIVGGKPAAQAAADAQAAISAEAAAAQLTPVATPAAPVVVATPAPNVGAPGATAIAFGLPMGKGGDLAARVVQQFNQDNPEIFVRLVDTFTGNDILSLPETAAQTDCFASPSPPAASALTATLDLQPLIDADAGFKLDDYPRALLAPYQADGHLRGLPWGMEVRVLVYNQDAFGSAGLAPPTDAWTMDDLLDAAQRLTGGSGDDRRYGLVIPRQTSQAAKLLVHLFGASLVRGEGDALAPDFTSMEAAQASHKVVDLLRNSTPHARLGDFAEQGPPLDYGELTGAGRVGMWMAWGLYAYGSDRPQFAMAMAPPPLAHAALDADDVATTGMYISAHTDKQQACWTWLKYFSGGAIGVIGGFPARRSVAQSPEFNQATPGASVVYNAYANALDRIGRLAPGGDAEDAPIDYYWFYRALDRALQGQDLDRELEQAQALTEQYVTCVRSGGQRDQCDRQTDPAYGQP